jgi:glycosyltransferase involved in cell wall biosynthesis
VKNVYLINLSFGLAGIERRFANLWRILHDRGVVFPILVVPASLAALLDDAGLLPTEANGMIVTPEPKPILWTAAQRLSSRFLVPAAILRSRVAAVGYRRVWSRIVADPNAVVHVGMNTSALKPPNVPTVYECVDANLEQLDTRHLHRASRRRCIVHCQSERIRAALEDRWANRAPRWRTITSPTYFAQYDESSSNGDRDSRLIVFVGRLAQEKNPLLFINAIARARQMGMDCHALMLGEGPLRAECEALIRQHALESVIAINFVPKPVALLRRAAVYVSLQTGDNYGSQSLLEAMGAGCAIIASDVGETRNIVTQDVGIRTTFEVESVAGAIVRIIGFSGYARQLGCTAERIAKTKYSADNYAVFLESVYDLADQHYRAVLL